MDDPEGVPKGTKGTVTRVSPLENLGKTQVAIDWENGSRLFLIIPPDQVKIIPRKTARKR